MEQPINLGLRPVYETGNVQRIQPELAEKFQDCARQKGSRHSQQTDLDAPPGDPYYTV